MGLGLGQAVTSTSAATNSSSYPTAAAAGDTLVSVVVNRDACEVRGRPHGITRACYGPAYLAGAYPGAHATPSELHSAPRIHWTSYVLDDKILESKRILEIFLEIVDGRCLDK